jgi:hypothetical protein
MAQFAALPEPLRSDLAAVIHIQRLRNIGLGKHPRIVFACRNDILIEQNEINPQTDAHPINTGLRYKSSMEEADALPNIYIVGGH